MLARGLLRRLAADVPKTSTHDLSQLTRLIHRAAITRNATSIRSICAVSHAYKLSSTIHRRSYVTAKTKPTRAKTTVKKTTATKKAAPKKKTTAAKKTAAPKKKAKAKTKAKTKAKAVKKPLSEKALEKAAAKKARDVLNEFKKKALAEPKKRPYTAWTVYTTENIKNAASNGQKALEGIKQLAQYYKDFTPAEREVSIRGSETLALTSRESC